MGASGDQKFKSRGTWSNGRGGQPQGSQWEGVRFQGQHAVSDKSSVVCRWAPKPRALLRHKHGRTAWGSGSQCLFSSGNLQLLLSWFYSKLYKIACFQNHAPDVVLQILQTCFFGHLDYWAFLSSRPSKAEWRVQLSPNEYFQCFKTRNIFSSMFLNPNQKPDPLYQQWS